MSIFKTQQPNLKYSLSETEFTQFCYIRDSFLVLNLSAVPNLSKIHHQNLFQKLVNLLDDIAVNPYSIVVFAQDISHPFPISWVYHAYSFTKREHRKNLQNTFIIEPTLWTRFLLAALSIVLSPKFYRKLVYIDSIKDCPRTIKDLVSSKCFHSPLLSETQVPIVVQECIQFIKENGLETEGIFRVPPSSFLLCKARMAYDSGSCQVDLNEYGGIHVACSLLKSFVRDLPEPIFSSSLYPLLSSLSSSSDVLNIIKTDILPRLNLSSHLLFKEILSLLYITNQYSEKNLMNAHNLCVVWGLNFLKSEDVGMDYALVSPPLGGFYLLLIHCIEYYKELF